MQALRGLLGGDQEQARTVIDELRSLARPLQTAADLDPLMERIGDARYVLLGEASHGTSEYYTWRSLISQRLIQEKGFSFIAVEGDWPHCYRVNRYVKGLADRDSSAAAVLRGFDRWPTWMWANREVVELVRWLRSYNDGTLSGSPIAEERKVGFYGLDVYSLWDSMEAVIGYLERVDPEAVHTAKRAYECFEPFNEDEQEYARATAFVPEVCEDEAVAMLAELWRKAPEYQEEGREAFFNAEQNALVARNAERYYRTMIRGGSWSWNVRDTHMADTLDRLMEFHGPEAKAIVWEHNTHIGDARATDMARAGMVNVGQLVRERHEDEGVVLIGFGSHHGSVIASRAWGAPMERMPMPAARDGSFEDLMRQAGGFDGASKSANGTLYIWDAGAASANGKSALWEPRGHRAIGVVYHPEAERYGNYVPTVLPRRYDAFLYVDETRALRPLHLEPEESPEPPETFPSGV